MASLNREARLYESVKNCLVAAISKIEASRRPINRSRRIWPDESHGWLPVSHRRAVKLQSASLGPATNDNLESKTSHVRGYDLKPVRLWPTGHHVKSTIQNVRACGPLPSSVLKYPEVRIVHRLKRAFKLYIRKGASFVVGVERSCPMGGTTALQNHRPQHNPGSNRRKIVLVQRKVVITAQQRLKNSLRVALNFTHPLVVALAADKSRLMIQLGRLERFPDRRTLRANESGRCESTLFRLAVQVFEIQSGQICSSVRSVRSQNRQARTATSYETDYFNLRA